MRKKDLAVFAMVMVSLATIFYKPLFSYDVWLHLKMGQYIVQHKYDLPTEDPFCNSTKNRPLMHHEWLSQVILYLVHGAFGFSGLRIMRVILELMALTFVFWTALCLSGRFLVAILVLFVVAYLFRTRYLIRPELFSLALLTFFYTYFATVEKKYGYGTYIVFFLLCLLWVNLHPFMIFLGVMITVLLVAQIGMHVPMLRRFFYAPQRPYNTIMLLLLFFIGSLISPNGFHIYRYVFGATPVVKRYILEWQPVFACLQSSYFKSITGGTLAFPWIMKDLVIAIIVLFFVTLFISYAKGIRWSLEDILFGLLMSYMALRAARFVWLLFIPMVLIIKYLSLYATRMRIHGTSKLVATASLSVAIVISGAYWIKEGIERIPYNVTHQIHAASYPLGAVAILRHTNLSGRLFNPMEWGGYIAYHLFPKYRIFMDTRSYLHGEEHIVDCMSIQYQSPGFESLINKYGFDILLFKKMFGDRAPLNSVDWILVYEDAGSAMYVKKDNRNSENLKRIARYYQQKGIAFDPKMGFDRKQPTIG